MSRRPFVFGNLLLNFKFYFDIQFEKDRFAVLGCGSEDVLLDGVQGIFIKSHP